MNRVGTFALVVLSLVGACAKEPVTSPPVTPAPIASVEKPAPVASVVDESFRDKPPASADPAPFVPPTILERKLANGVRVLLVERHQLPLVAFQIVVDRGADQGSPGVGAFLGAMLTQGTKKRTALEISDALGKLGAQYGSWGGFDSVGVSAKVITSGFPEALAILADCLREPSFAKDEVERERSKRLTSLAQQKDSPQTLLRNAVSESLYPSTHPYHAPLLGTEAALKKLSSKDLAAFHKKLVQPGDITVAIAGDITESAALAEVEKVFGDWKGKPDSPAALKEVDKTKGARILVIDRPGATQSHMAATLIGVPRSTKDFHALMVMNTILGGQFSSRLNMNLREKHAYTYGAGSSFDMRHGAGPFTAGGAIVREKTEPAATEILAEMKRMQDALVSDEELADAKTNLIRRLPASFETVSDVAGSIAYLAIYGLPLDEFNKRAEAYRAVTREDVQRVAKLYLSPEQVRFVIVGDASAIQKDLEKLNMGKVEVQSSVK